MISLLPNKFSPDVPSLTSLIITTTIKGYVPSSLKVALTTSSADNQTWFDSHTEEYDSLRQTEKIKYILIQEYNKLGARFKYEIV